jgi:hypothetical protein
LSIDILRAFYEQDLNNQGILAVPEGSKEMVAYTDHYVSIAAWISVDFCREFGSSAIHLHSFLSIEFNPTILKTVEFVQPADPRLCQGSSLLSISKLAQSKDYELVCTTKTNAIFVDSKFFKLFGTKDNSVETMMTDESLVPHIFCGYYGTVFIRGYGVIPWQGISYKESKVQQLPRWARKIVGDRNIIRRKAGKIFRRLRKKKII